ncbi:MAG: hypothetical protein MPW15_16315 [Candidatus Manganitrophus sp.]|nr:hypothetical protein [Candidatus Manganitrophus sp.]
MIVSGINKGGNLGDDVTYSGTVSAAMEGTLLGIPSIAFSQLGDGQYHFETAARFAVGLVRLVLKEGLSREVFLNVNVPESSPERRSRGFGSPRSASGFSTTAPSSRTPIRAGENISGSASTE